MKAYTCKVIMLKVIDEVCLFFFVAIPSEPGILPNFSFRVAILTSVSARGSFKHVTKSAGV